MIHANYFSYDGVFSDNYGLQIASFDSETVQTTTVFAPTLKSSKAPYSDRFNHEGINYDSPLEYDFNVISERPIDATTRREILRWLVGRKKFKRLQFHQQGLEDIYYNCVFTVVDSISVNGWCHGFQLKATFDSHYAYAAPFVANITGDGTPQTVYISNMSDVVDDYVYPVVEFRATTAVNNKNILIVNVTDANRVFSFSGLANNEEISVDNKTQIITSNIGGEKISCLDDFKWMRLRQGRNELTVTINGTARITCPTQVLIGF